MSNDSMAADKVATTPKRKVKVPKGTVHRRSRKMAGAIRITVVIRMAA